MTDSSSYGIIPVYEESTGYILLTDGSHKQVICKVAEDCVILHWKFDGSSVKVTRDEWLSLFTATST